LNTRQVVTCNPRKRSSSDEYNKRLNALCALHEFLADQGAETCLYFT
jgi:hypothetical protein